MSQVNAVNASIMSLLVEQVAQGKLRAASIVSQVQPGVSLRVGDWSVSFKKVKPGDFTVSTYQGDEGTPVTQERASTPVEAKLMAIDMAVAQWKTTHPAPAAAQ